jgi:hypothetical protein
MNRKPADAIGAEKIPALRHLVDVNPDREGL